jgi:hypothetical protein
LVGKNRDKDKDKVNTLVEKSASYCGISGKRSCIWGMAVILALIVAYYFHDCCDKKNVFGVKAHDEEYQSKISLLQMEISQLKAEMQQMQRTDQKLHGRDNIREKWKIWMALGSKIESQEPLEKEWEQFRRLFANDEETLKLVEAIIQEANLDKSACDNKIVDFCKKYLKRLIKFKKTYRRKLMKISGYVLSSPSSYGKEEKE